MAWIAGWSHRKTVTITGQSGAGTDYQVNLSIGDASGGDFHLENHCTSFPNDIQVTDNDQTTPLDYWVEDLTLDPISMWVEVTDDLGINKDVCVYYSKSGESSASNGVNTFGALFDDFSTVDSGIWTVTGSPTTDGDIITCQKDKELVSISGFSNTVALRVRITLQHTAVGSSGFIEFSESSVGGARDYTYDLYGNYPTADVVNATVEGGAPGAFSMGNDGSTPHIYDALRSGTQCEMLCDGVSKGTLTSGSSATNYIRLAGDISTPPKTGTIKSDWVLIRKYLSPTEPAFSSAGSEESAPLAGGSSMYAKLIGAGLI